MENIVTKWESWWFPGVSELLNMLSYAFWWEVSFVLAAIPILIVVAIISAVSS